MAEHPHKVARVLAIALAHVVVAAITICLANECFAVLPLGISRLTYI